MFNLEYTTSLQCHQASCPSHMPLYSIFFRQCFLLCQEKCLEAFSAIIFSRGISWFFFFFYLFQHFQMLRQTEKSSLKNILKHIVTSCTKIILTLFSIYFSSWFLSHMLQMLLICLFVYTTNISDSFVQYCSLPMFLEEGWVTGGE